MRHRIVRRLCRWAKSAAGNRPRVWRGPHSNQFSLTLIRAHSGLDREANRARLGLNSILLNGYDSPPTGCHDSSPKATGTGVACMMTPPLTRFWPIACNRWNSSGRWAGRSARALTERRSHAVRRPLPSVIQQNSAGCLLRPKHTIRRTPVVSVSLPRPLPSGWSSISRFSNCFSPRSCRTTG